MQFKNYYAILGVDPTASIEEIKKSYRKLALQHHPDINNDDDAHSSFAAINEAYETLTDPLKKKKYLNQQNNFFNGQKKKMELTVFDIVEQSIKIERQVVKQDEFRMDKLKLKKQILSLLTVENIQVLIQDNDENAKNTIIQLILKAAKPLLKDDALEVASKLMEIAGQNVSAQYQIKKFKENARKKHFWDRFSVVAILIVTILLCLLIYLASQ
ncbi:MAG: J domain-containing protein [Bacteroidetes bacterium]|nr:J domain-containing protein [Bacteroidota bacterium]